MAEVAREQASRLRLQPYTSVGVNAVQAVAREQASRLRLQHLGGTARSHPCWASSEGTGFSFEIATYRRIGQSVDYREVAREQASRLRLQPIDARAGWNEIVGSEGTGFSFEIATLNSIGIRVSVTL